MRMTIPARHARRLIVAAALMLGLTSLAPLLHRDAEAQSVTAPPVSVSYLDTHHPPANGLAPSPWLGSPNVVFVGTTSDWDTGAVKVDNTTGADMTNVQVTLDISDGVTSTHWGLWNPMTIPAGQSLIVTETAFQNFDLSDEPPNPPSPFQASGIYPAADCTPDSATPVVHITIGATTFDYFDTTHVLTTGGVDRSHCPAGTDESLSWTRVNTSAAPPTATPTNTPNPVATATPTPTNTPVVAAPTNTPTPTNTPVATGTVEWAVGLAEAGVNPGAWTVPAPFQFAVNWNGSPGARPEAIVYAQVALGGTITGPIVTNASAQSNSGGSLLLLQGSGLLLRGSTPGHHTSGVAGGTSATIPAPVGLAAGDLVLVYIDTPNTMTPPTGWTQQRHDGQGTVWSRTFTTVPANLGTWSTTGGSGWDYSAAAFGASSGSPTIVGVGGGGAQTTNAVSTGSATPGGPVSTPTPTPTATPTNTPNPVATATPTPTNTPVVAAPTNTPTPTNTPVATGAVEWAVGLAEAGVNPGAWTVPAPFQFAVNWNGSPGARPEAIVYAQVPLGGTITGPTVTNAGAQSSSGGSLVLLKGPGLLLRGSTPGHHTSGVTGGTSATIPAPVGLAAGDLVLVYLDSPNTMTPPPGWTLRRQDGEGTVWSQTFATVPANLGTWSTTGSHGWDYSAAAFGASSGSPAIVATGGGGAQTSNVVQTGSATPP
jgi:hypothetical protein